MSDQNEHSNRFRTRTAKVATQEVLASTRARGGDDSWVVIYAVARAEVTRRFVLRADRAAYEVGRSSQCDITVDSTAASRKHCRLQCLHGEWWVVDLGSLNGTYVNDVAVPAHRPARLRHGDRVQVGDTIFKHLSGDDVESAYVEAIAAATHTDGLTQAANDAAFREALSSTVARARAQDIAASLVLADLDHFKSVNDGHGHPAGDRVLREFAQVARGCAPVDALVARVGGEEFGLLLPGRGLAPARALAERVRAAVEAHAFATPRGPLRVTASFGVAELGAGPEDATRWFERADQALYAAKRGGRNRVAG